MLSAQGLTLRREYARYSCVDSAVFRHRKTPRNLPEERVYFWAVLKAFLRQSKNGQDRRVSLSHRQRVNSFARVTVFFVSSFRKIR